MSVVTTVAMALWRKLAGGESGKAETRSALPPPPPTGANDPAFAPWAAFPGIIARTMGDSPWSLPSAAAPWRPVEDEAGHQRWLRKAWRTMPAYCERAGLPRPDGEQG